MGLLRLLLIICGLLLIALHPVTAAAAANTSTVNSTSIRTDSSIAGGAIVPSGPSCDVSSTLDSPFVFESPAFVSNSGGGVQSATIERLCTITSPLLGWLARSSQQWSGGAAGFVAATALVRVAVPLDATSYSSSGPRSTSRLGSQRSCAAMGAVAARLATAASLALMPSPARAALGVSDLAAMRAISSQW